MFPDPEAFNPLRWIKPEFPTYREPLTEFPTIINSTQFGYGRRLCQGQTVADEDLLIGIGSLAWLFNIGKNADEGAAAASDAESDEEAPDSGYESVSETSSPGQQSEKQEDEDEQSLLHPGSWPILSPIEQAAEAAEAHKKREARRMKKKTAAAAAETTNKIDPTLDFSTLLIAKPLPFSFNLSVRDEAKADAVRKQFEELAAQGHFRPSDVYWGENQGKGQPLGWGKV